MPTQVAGALIDPPGWEDPLFKPGLVAGLQIRLRDGWMLLARRAPPLPVHTLVLRVTAQGWLHSAPGKAPEPALRIDFADTGVLLALLRPRDSGRGNRSQRLLLLIEEDLALVEQIVVAAKPAPVLDRLIEQRIRHLSPFEPEETVSIVSRRARDATTQHIDLAVVDRQSLDDTLEQVQEAGAVLAGIGLCRGNQTLFVSPIAETAQENGLLARWSALSVNLRTALLCTGLVVATYMTVLTLNNSRAEELRGDASAAAERIAKRTRQAEQSLAMTAQHKASANLILGLESLSAQLPDGAWLEIYRLEDKQISMTFYAPSANETRALVETLPGLSGVAIDGSITRDSAAKLERFVITAKLVPTKPAGSP
jgi:Tfp pilus assembly protein PilN